MRINTEYKFDQTLISADSWSLELIAGTGSLAAIQLNITGSDSTIYSGSTTYFPVFNDEYTQIVVNRTLRGSNYVYDIYGKEGFNERIRSEGSSLEYVGLETEGSLITRPTVTTGSATGSDSLIVPTSNVTWGTGTEIVVGSTFHGSIDEFRLWTIPLTEANIVNHTLLPDAIDGNSYNSSTEDLLFRLDFEYPKDRNADVDIKNVSINRFYDESYATASNFISNTTYPYQYTPYERTVTAKVPSTGIGVANKIRFESQTLENYLKFGDTSNVTSFENADDSNKLGLFFSPTREINMDILRSLGSFNIDNYIGNPSDEYADKYSELDTLRNYYFERYDLNIYEYIQLVRYIDTTLFTTLKSLVPGRANTTTGLLIEPHLLERSKLKSSKPIAEDLTHETLIDTTEIIELISTYNVHEATITENDTVEFVSTNPQYDVTISTADEEVLAGENNSYDVTIPVMEDDIDVIGEMELLEVDVDAKIEGTVTGEYYGITLTQVGMDPDSIYNAGFGIVGTNGHTLRTTLDKFGNIIRERVQVYKIKESYTVKVPENLVAGSVAEGTHFVEQIKYRNKVTFLSFPSGSTPATAPALTGNIVEVTPLNGYFPSHYRNVGDLTTGMENSWWNGAKQTALTTLDGGSPVQTFTTNPNTLRVSDTGRGSGEPILQTD